MVLGSNPSKANPTLEADRIDAPRYERGDSWFNSNRGFKSSVGATVAQISYKDKVERSNRSRKKYCIVAQLVERLTVNQDVTGSNPVDAAMEVIRPDEELVLKTGARKGCRCESMPLPPYARIAQTVEQTVDNRSVGSSILSSCTILEGGVNGNSGRSERLTPSSSLGLPKLWLSYKGGVSRITRDCDSRHESSILSSHTISGFRSSADRLLWEQDAAGSIPATRTTCA